MSTSHVVSDRATGESGGEIVRYTLSERVQHWLGALTYIYCLSTGLAFWSPYMFWLAAVVGGGPTARFWHPWFGLAFALSVGWMYKIWRGDLATTDADRRWWKAINHYVENDDEKLPPVADHETPLFMLSFATVPVRESGCSRVRPARLGETETLRVPVAIVRPRVTDLVCLGLPESAT